jgi:hypothetical protein
VSATNTVYHTDNKKLNFQYIKHVILFFYVKILCLPSKYFYAFLNLYSSIFPRYSSPLVVNQNTTSSMMLAMKSPVRILLQLYKTLSVPFSYTQCYNLSYVCYFGYSLFVFTFLKIRAWFYSFLHPSHHSP